MIIFIQSDTKIGDKLDKKLLAITKKEAFRDLELIYAYGQDLELLQDVASLLRNSKKRGSVSHLHKAEIGKAIDYFQDPIITELFEELWSKADNQLTVLATGYKFMINFALYLRDKGCLLSNNIAPFSSEISAGTILYITKDKSEFFLRQAKLAQ